MKASVLGLPCASPSQTLSAPSPLWWFLLFIRSHRRLPPASLHVHVKVQHQQLGLLGAVAAAHGAHQLGVGGPDSPHHTAAAATLQRHQVADELARLQVPQLDRAVVRAGDDKVLVELEACHSALVLVGTWEEKEATGQTGAEYGQQRDPTLGSAGKSHLRTSQRMITLQTQYDIYC